MTLKGPGYLAEYRVLCALLRQYREEAGMSQGELATALQVTQSSISKIESPVDRRLDLIEMKAYLAPLGKKLSDLAADLERELSWT